MRKKNVKEKESSRLPCRAPNAGRRVNRLLGGKSDISVGRIRRETESHEAGKSFVFDGMEWVLPLVGDVQLQRTRSLQETKHQEE